MKEEAPFAFGWSGFVPANSAIPYDGCYSIPAAWPSSDHVLDANLVLEDILDSEEIG